MTPNLHFYDFNSTSDHAEKLSAIALIEGVVCSSPELSFENILQVFTKHEGKGYKNLIEKSEMNLNDFLSRAQAISGKISNDHINAIKILLNPDKNTTAKEVICLAPSKHTAPKKDDYHPPKDLHEPPVRLKSKSLNDDKGQKPNDKGNFNSKNPNDKKRR
jgi:hypothetical protein